MMENGWRIKLKVMEFTNILKVQDTKVNGKMINNTDTVLKFGLTEVNMRVNISKEINMEKESLYGLMVPIITVISIKIIFRAKVYMSGMMEEVS